MSVSIKQLVFRSTTLAASLLISTGAFAVTPGDDDGGGGSGAGFSELFSEASGDGDCRVSRESGPASTFFIPQGGSGNYNVLVWGNGTGGSPGIYSGLLRSVASHCIAVAAADTANAGSGEEMQRALQGIRSRFGDQLGDKVCTAGHSQGGGGSFNAANLIDADCVISVQADTRFTTRIRRDLDSDVEVIALWGSTDTLAPASGNRRNVQQASSILTQVETQGEGHFAPIGGGGDIGTMFSMANIAQLSNDSERATRFRQAFWGPTTEYTATENHRDISDVRRNQGAESTQP